jgi:hypothetical protein
MQRASQTITGEKPSKSGMFSKILSCDYLSLLNQHLMIFHEGEG